MAYQFKNKPKARVSSGIILKILFSGIVCAITFGC